VAEPLIGGQATDGDMTYTVEVLLRETHSVVTERIHHSGPQPADWTEEDVSAMLKGMLMAVDRVKNPGAESAAPVALRGISWIVTPFEKGVAIAIEIYSGTAVAGPSSIDQQRLEGLIARVMSGPSSGGTVVH
jgi:hypothetical protein